MPRALNARSTAALFACATLALIAPAARAGAPNGLVLSGTTVAENLPAGTTVGTLTTLDPDVGDTFSYVLITNPLDSFVLDGNRLATAAPLDFEAGAQRSVTVRTTDASGAWLEKSFTITTLDRNDAPTGVSLSSTGVAEDAQLSALVGRVAPVGDDDQGDAWTYDLIDDGDGRFVLEGTELRVAAPLDHEDDPFAIVTLAVVDRVGASAETTLTLAIWDRNEPPTGIAFASAGTIAENAPLGAIVGSLTAVGDPDAGDAHTFRIANADGPFIVDGANLRLSGALDYETKALFMPVVRATDRGGKTVEVAVPIFVTDANEAPTSVALSAATVAENAAVGSVVGTLSATDPDAGATVSFTLVAGAGFRVVGTRLETSRAFDFEATPSASVTVRATDAGGLSRDATFTIAIGDKNEAPTELTITSPTGAATITIAESAAPNAVAGFVDVTDPDQGDQHELLLLDDGAGAFRLEGTILRVARALDHESAPTVALSIRAKDRGGLTIIASVTIQVSDVDEPASGIALDPASVRENQPAGTLVGTLSPVGDPDSAAGYTWALVQNPGGWLAVQGQKLVTTRALDFETTRQLTVRVKATPPVGAAIEQALTVDVSDEPEAPLAILASASSIPEGRGEGAYVASLSALGDPDANDLPTFSLVDNPDDAFVVQGSTLSTAKVLDYETRATYRLVLRATDRSGLHVDAPLEVRVLDVNEAPTGVALSARELAENSAPGTVVGTLTALGDPDGGADAHTFTLTQNSDDRFEIVGDALVVRTALDFERDPTSHRLSVRVRDGGGLTAESSFLVVVTDQNEAPSAITIDGHDVAENAPAGTVVGVIGGGLDPDAGDAGTWSVAHDALGDAFAVDAQHRLVTRRPLDHEREDGAAVTVRLTDAGGHVVEASALVAVDDVPEPPTGVTLDPASVRESAPVGAFIGALAAVGDPDRGDSATLTLTEDVDGRFAIVDGALVVAAPLDFEAASHHEIAVSATDSAGLAVTTRFTVKVLDDEDPPVAGRTSWAMPGIDEDDKNPDPVLVSAILDGLDVVDPDGDPVSLRVIAADTTNGRWQRKTDEWLALEPGDVLADDALVRFLPLQDFNGTARLTLAPSDGGATGAAVFVTVAVDAVNDAPHITLPLAEIEGWQQAPLDVTAAMGGPLAVDDVDAPALELTLACDDGALSLPTAGLEVVAGEDGSGALTVFGDLAALDAALTRLVLLPDAGFVGRTEIAVSLDDRGASGQGGARTSHDAIGVTVRAAPDLIVTIGGEPVTGDVDLGVLGAEAWEPLDIGLENAGDEPLTLADPAIALSPTADTEAWLVVLPPATIAPGAAVEAHALVRAAVGPVRATLTVTSDDPTTPTFEATLAGRAIAAPDLRVSDGQRRLEGGLTHVVHDMAPATTTRLDLTLDNVGAARLDLGDLLIASATNASVDLDAPFPLIDPGDSETLTLYLTPSLPGPVAVELELPSSDPDLPLFVVSLYADAVAAPEPRLVLTRVPGVLVAAGRDEDLGFARAGEDLAAELRLVNLGGRDAKAPVVTVANEDNCAARVALEVPDALAPGDVLALSLIARPERGGPFALDLVVGDARWHLTGTAANDAPPDALRLYRWGGGRVATSDLLGPVTPSLPVTLGWSIVNDGPDRVDLALPVALSALDNVDARPLGVPPALLPARASHLVRVEATALATGPLGFDLDVAALPTVRVASGGQVGALAIESDGGERYVADSVVTLPLGKVGRDVIVTLYAVNTGTGPLTLGAPTLEDAAGSDACVRAEPTADATLPPGERSAFRVVLAPEVGTYACTLTLPSDDPARPAFVLTLAARGARAGSDGCGAGPTDASPLLAALFALVYRRRRHGGLP